jgi:hypothetical protein
MRFRKLRIAWSVMCAIACVLLLVLWVRSYWCADLLIVSQTQGVVSTQGAVRVCDFNLDSPAPQWMISFPETLEGATSADYSIFGFSNSQSPSSLLGRTRVPYWFFVFLSVVAATTPWIRFRFTLRTLLIAITAVAVVLGLAVYLGK